MLWFPFICFKLITWRVLLVLLTPKPPYESCSGNLSVQVHWEMSIKLNWNFSQKEYESFKKSMFSGPAWNYFCHSTPCLVFRVTTHNVGYPEFHTTCKYLIMYTKLNASRKTSYKSSSQPCILSEQVHSDPAWKTLVLVCDMNKVETWALVSHLTATCHQHWFILGWLNFFF